MFRKYKIDNFLSLEGNSICKKSSNFAPDFKNEQIVNHQIVMIMTLKEAIRVRHAVRKYTDKPIEAEKIAQIRALVDECNRESGLHIQFVTDEPLAFSTGLFKYGQFSGVKNYLVLIAPKGKAHDEAIGYYGEKIVLTMTTLGLQTCWVALTYKAIKDAYELREGEEVKLVVACGYGQTEGFAHPQKKAYTEFVEDKRKVAGQPLPQWFVEGMEGALLAPTAMNQQKFVFTLLDDNKVQARAKFDITGNAGFDLGIVRRNFEIAAGKEHFEWA